MNNINNANSNGDGLPSKLICVRYTLAVCGCNPHDAERLIDEMIEKRKKHNAIFERIQAEYRGLPESLLDKLYPKTWA